MYESDECRWVGLAFILFAWIGIQPFMSSAWAYNSYSHNRITRLAIQYLQNNPNFYPESQKWFSANTQDEFLIQETLVRSNIDTDYRPDFWFTSEFHAPAMGVYYDSLLYTFTSIQHFLDTTRPGKFWKLDGYSFSRSSKQGKDEILIIPSVKASGGLSTTLGGNYPEFSLPGVRIPPYFAGFLGTQADWQNFYFKGTDIRDVVFPPAMVPADLAFQTMLASPRAAETTLYNWDFNLPVITLAGTSHLTRHFMRGEVRGLPKELDALGITIHLIQDLTVPQHTLGTLDLCHSEYEILSDELEGQVPYAQIDFLKYQSGFYIGERPFISGLYDETLVKKFLSDHLKYPPLDHDSTISLPDRIISVAQSTGKWGWAKRAKGYETTLPSGSLYTGVSCNDLMTRGEVRTFVKRNFNYAIAATVFILEKAAHEYENQNR